MYNRDMTVRVTLKSGGVQRDIDDVFDMIGAVDGVSDVKGLIIFSVEGDETLADNLKKSLGSDFQITIQSTQSCPL